MKKKFFKIVLSGILCVLFVFGVCACSIFEKTDPNAENGGDAQIREIYDLYVENCAEGGQTPLTYDEWLASVKGEKGDPGANGEDGNGWLYGDTAPASGLGKVGDLYLNYSTWDVYTKEAAGWTLRGNIKGEKGDPGTGGGTEGGDGTTAELQIHFLELGNQTKGAKYNGDSIYIKVGDVDILVDGGSREASANVIEEYVDTYCTDNTLEYVIVTHADQDHIAAWAGNSTYTSLFERFECEKIIDFPLTDKNTQVYGRYQAARDAEVALGAVHYTALECYNNVGDAKRSYELADGITLNFLYNYYYDHRSNDENNYSVCFYINQGENNYLFTGDLEESGEQYLVQNNTLPKCKVYKAGHHGSKTSSNECLLNVIQPEYVCVCCVAGAPEYTLTDANIFPTQDFIDRVSKYTQNVYVTSIAVGVVSGEKKWDHIEALNGNIVVKSNGVDFSVQCSNNNTLLKDTQWFKEHRTCPAAWLS